MGCQGGYRTASYFCLSVRQSTPSTPGVLRPRLLVTRLTAHNLAANECASIHCKAFALLKRFSLTAFAIRTCSRYTRRPAAFQSTEDHVSPEPEGAHADLTAASICFPPSNRFHKLSRNEAPDGRQLRFRPDHVSTRIQTITARHSLLPSSQSRISISSPRGSPALRAAIRGSHVPRRYQSHLGPACTPVAQHLRWRTLDPPSWPLTFWSKPLSTIWLVLNDGACSGSHLLTL